MVTCSSMKFEVTACELSSYWSVLLRRDSALIKIRAVQIRDSLLLGLLLLGFADPSLPLDRPVGCPFQVAPTPPRCTSRSLSFSGGVSYAHEFVQKYAGDSQVHFSDLDWFLEF